MKNSTKLEKSVPYYFDELPESIQKITADSIREAFTVETWGNRDVEPIECRARDGFSPFSHNRGGLELSDFNDTGYVNGSGCFPAHKKARKVLEDRIEQAYKDTSESVFDRHSALLLSKGLKMEDCTYHRMEDLQKIHPELSEVRRDIEETEQEMMSGECDSIMYSLRVMYHGCENGIHSASISAAVNLEGPYHRSHISWAPNVFCEGAKEIEISWKSENAYEKKLKRALKQVAKEVL